jgi:hypothetical protein
VTYRIDDDVDYEPRRESRRVPWLSIVVVVGLATIGVTSAVLWRTYGNVLPGFPTSSSVNGPTVQSVDKVDGLRELQTLQQQSAGQMQAVVQLLTFSAGRNKEAIRTDDGAYWKSRHTSALGHSRPANPGASCSKTGCASKEAGPLKSDSGESNRSATDGSGPNSASSA